MAAPGKRDKTCHIHGWALLTSTCPHLEQIPSLQIPPECHPRGVTATVFPTDMALSDNCAAPPLFALYFELLVPAVDISFSTEMGPPLAGWLVARLSWARVSWAGLWGLHARATGKDKAGPAWAAVPLLSPRALQTRQGASGGRLARRSGWSTAELQGGGDPGPRLLPWEPPGGKACRTLASSIFGISGLKSSLRGKKPCRPRETRVILGTSWANIFWQLIPGSDNAQLAGFLLFLPGI